MQEGRVPFDAVLFHDCEQCPAFHVAGDETAFQVVNLVLQYRDSFVLLVDPFGVLVGEIPLVSDDEPYDQPEAATSGCSCEPDARVSEGHMCGLGEQRTPGVRADNPVDIETEDGLDIADRSIGAGTEVPIHIEALASDAV